MKKFLFLFLMVGILSLSSSIQATEKAAHTSPVLKEVILSIPLESLIFDPEGISINYEGNLLAVHSLWKIGDSWTVKAASRCPNGHRVVCSCGGCGVSSCGYCCSCYSEKKTLSD